MECPHCKTVCGAGVVLCPACHTVLTARLYAAPARRTGQGGLSVRQCLGTLLLGLVPLAGIMASLLWAYSPKASPQRRTLAKALLWVHAAVLILAIVVLFIWVAGLAVRYAHVYPVV